MLLKQLSAAAPITDLRAELPGFAPALFLASCGTSYTYLPLSISSVSYSAGEGTADPVAGWQPL